MVQGGCPHGTGTGGPGYHFEDETRTGLTTSAASCRWPTPARAPTAASSSSPTSPCPWLDGKHTVFGEVIEGQEIVDTVKQGDTIKSVKIEGDTAALLAAKADRVAEWNKTLDAK